MSWDLWTPRGPYAIIVYGSYGEALLLYLWLLCYSEMHDWGLNGLDVLMSSQGSGINVFEIMCGCVSLKISMLNK